MMPNFSETNHEKNMLESILGALNKGETMKDEPIQKQEEKLTLRDEYFKAALTGLLSRSLWSNVNELVLQAFKIADAALEFRGSKQESYSSTKRVTRHPVELPSETVL